MLIAPLLDILSQCHLRSYSHLQVNNCPYHCDVSQSVGTDPGNVRKDEIRGCRKILTLAQHALKSFARRAQLL